MEVCRESRQERAGRRGRVRNRFPMSQGTAAVTVGGGGGEEGNWVQPSAPAMSAESKQAVRNMRPLNYSNSGYIKAVISTASWLSLSVYLWHIAVFMLFP